MSVKKPWIAVVCHRNLSREGIDIIPDELSPRYTTAILKAGGLPILIPIDYPLTELRRLRDTFDGILLAGGNDVETQRYHGKEHPSVSRPCPERDELEIALTRLAIETDWPIFGICRGIQVMNVAMGGTLFSDIADQVPGTLRHNSPADTPRNHAVHNVSILENSHTATILGVQLVAVNSFHHQAVAEAAPCFSVSGFSEDGLIEALEAPRNLFALGVQWHPECMQEYPEHMNLFRAFIAAAAGGER